MNTTEILERVKLFLNAKSDTELSLKLGKFQNYVYQLKKRNGIDLDILLQHCPDADLDWLLTGETNVIKSIASIDSKGNRIELTSTTRVSDQEHIKGFLLGFETGLEDTYNTSGKGVSSETFQQLRETLDKRNEQLLELSDKLFELQKLVAEYQLRDRGK
jgi:hypothetical protein